MGSSPDQVALAAGAAAAAGPAFERVIFEEAAIGLWVSDRAGNVLDVNPAGCAMLGYTREALLGMNLESMTHPDDVAVRRRVAEAPAGTSATAQRRLRRADGGWVLVEGHAKILPDGRIITATVDVTEHAETQAALAASEREFRAVFELAAAGKAQTDVETDRFLRVNRKLCEITGYSEEELLARTTADVTHPDDRVRDRETVGRAVRGEAPGWSIEKRYVRKDGELRWVHVTGSLMRDAAGRPFRTVATILDVTDRKRTDEALRARERELREADRRKDEFLAVLSHELRNPLTPMRNALHLLERGAPGAADARQAREVIGRQLEHLARLVEDLLDVTRISRGKVNVRLEPLALADLVRRAVEDHASVLEAAGLRVELALPAGDPVPVRGDATRLAQVVGNVLQNAAKFTPEGGRVSVSLDRADGEARLRVRDDGVGISPEVMARLFTPFEQGEQPLDRSRGGLGLGLALAKGFVELHGGRVVARSDGPGRGTEIEVRLPLAPGATARGGAAGGAHGAGPARPAEGAARRILVVDDNSDAADTLADLLALEGHDVRVAYSGPDALETARRARPDLLLCDIGLPEMDGYAVARAFRADPALAAVKLVALTGYAGAEDQRRAREAGFDRHVAKPPPLETLQAILAGKDGPAPA